jgi:hypothetical protein
VNGVNGVNGVNKVNGVSKVNRINGKSGVNGLSGVSRVSGVFGVNGMSKVSRVSGVSGVKSWASLRSFGPFWAIRHVCMSVRLSSLPSPTPSPLRVPHKGFIGHQPLWEPMPCHLTPKPPSHGASGYR